MFSINTSISCMNDAAGGDVGVRGDGVCVWVLGTRDEPAPARLGRARLDVREGPAIDIPTGKTDVRPGMNDDDSKSSSGEGEADSWRLAAGLPGFKGMNGLAVCDCVVAICPCRLRSIHLAPN